MDIRLNRALIGVLLAGFFLFGFGCSGPSIDDPEVPVAGREAQRPDGPTQKSESESDPFAPALPPVASPPTVPDSSKEASKDPSAPKMTEYPNDESTPSFVQILAHKDHYHGKNIQIAGYLRVEFEGTAIYLCKEHADYVITTNGFSVTLSKAAAKFDRKYVLLEGTFDKNYRGHFNGWAGGIRNVTRILELTKHE